MAPAVVASSISRLGRARPSPPCSSRGTCRGGWTRLHGERGHLRGRRCLIHLEARVEEGRRGPMESEGVCRDWDAAHGASRCRLVHLKARKGAAVVASSILMPASRRVDAAPRRASCGGRFRSVLHSRNSVVGGRGKPFHPGLILVVERLVVQPTPAGTGHRLDPSSASSPAPGVDVHERAAEVLVGGRSGFLAHLFRPHVSRFTRGSRGTAYPTRRGGFAIPAAVRGWAPVRWAWCALGGRRGVPSAGRRGACRVRGLGGLLRFEFWTSSISRPASRKVNSAHKEQGRIWGLGCVP